MVYNGSNATKWILYWNRTYFGESLYVHCGSYWGHIDYKVGFKAVCFLLNGLEEETKPRLPFPERISGSDVQEELEPPGGAEGKWCLYFPAMVFTVRLEDQRRPSWPKRPTTQEICAWPAFTFLSLQRPAPRCLLTLRISIPCINIPVYTRQAGSIKWVKPPPPPRLPSARRQKACVVPKISPVVWPSSSGSGSRTTEV